MFDSKSGNEPVTSHVPVMLIELITINFYNLRVNKNKQ